MRKTFAEYYELSEERIKEIWDDSLIVFDTNVLLNLYRYDVNVQEDFINVMKFYKERLWIPYQVGLEFHRNRTEKIRNNKNAYKSLKESLEKDLLKAVDSLCSNGNYTRHPYIDVEGIKEKVKKCVASISKSLDKLESKHPDYMQSDTILNTITDLFDGRVGSDFQSTDLETLYKDGEKRYANQIPPGYCDEKKKKNEQKRRLYGDLIVWKQTIHHSKTEKRNVIFVTDDYKEDWWDKVEGKHSPRKELIKEFVENTGQDILIYNSARFLEYAKQNKELKVSQKTIKEVEKVRNADITRYMNETIRAITGKTDLLGINEMGNYFNHIYNPMLSYDFLPDISFLESWRQQMKRTDGVDAFNRFREELRKLNEISVSLNKQKSAIEVIESKETEQNNTVE